MTKPSLLFVLLAGVGPAMAQTGDITFHGEVMTDTCVVEPNDPETGSGDFTVRLPNISQFSLLRAGQRGAHTPFFIRVGSDERPCLLPRVRALFRNAGDTNAAGRLINRGTAGNVDVVVLNSKGEDIDLNSNANVEVVPIDPGVGYTYIEWYASYHATAAARPGTVTAAVEYMLDYP